MEFCGILVTILTIVAHGGRDVTIRPTGDSMVALAWARAARVKGGDHTVTTALIFALVCMRFRIHIFETLHIPGEHNIIPDALSRGYTDVINASGDSFVINRRRNYYDFAALPSISSLLALCNPLLPPPVTDDDFIHLWSTINTLLDSLPSSRAHPC